MTHHTAPIRLLLADGRPGPRARLRTVLDAEADIEVIAEAEDGRQALRSARERRPDIVLTDVTLPGLDGIEVTRRITADPALAQVRVVILTGDSRDRHVFEALRAGAAGYLVDDTTPAELAHALRVVARGDALLAPSVTRQVIGRLVARSLPRPHGPHCSPN